MMECLCLIWMDHGGFCFPTLVARFQDHHHLPLTKTRAYASLLGFLHCHHPTIIKDGACMLDLDGGCLFPTPLSHRRSFSRSPPTSDHSRKHACTPHSCIATTPPPLKMECTLDFDIGCLFSSMSPSHHARFNVFHLLHLRE